MCPLPQAPHFPITHGTSVGWGSPGIALGSVRLPVLTVIFSSSFFFFLLLARYFYNKSGKSCALVAFGAVTVSPACVVGGWQLMLCS